MTVRDRAALAILGFLIAFALPASSFASTSGNRARCESWLAEHYENFSKLFVIREYTEEGEYHLRANYNVQPKYGSFTAIGFDCTIDLASGKMVAVPDLDTYRKEHKIKPELSSLSKHRMSSGGDGCDELSSWKLLSDEMHKGNFSARLTGNCTWLEKGQVVLGPVKSAKYKGSGFALIALPKGKRLWIEDVHL